MRTRIALALMCIAPSIAVAQRVTGVVRAAGTLSPMSEVTVTVLDSVKAAVAQGQTDPSGRYTIPIQPDARYIRATRIGYRPVDLAIPPGSGDAVVDVTMEVFRELDTVVSKAPEQRYVPPRLQEFDKRRLSGMGGHFISEEELRKHDGRSVGDILRTYSPGVRMEAYRGGLYAASFSTPTMSALSKLTRDRRSPTGCWVNVYLDGTPIYTGESGSEFIPAAPDMKQFLALTLSGVEYYGSASSLPLQYKNTRNNCGTLLLWTRGK